MSVWDDPELQNDSEYVTFDAVGDAVAGTVQSVRKHTWADGSSCPKVNIVTAEGVERTVTAGQVRLKAELASLRPEPGDHISIKLTEVEKRAGGKTLKHFEVKVERSGDTTAAVVTSLPAQGQDPALAAAIASLTPEQLAALQATSGAPF
jgi:hypothetical protein